MLVLNLRCGLEHGFEGWFGSATDFESQLERGLIACPICANAQVTRMPSAPRLNVGHVRKGAVRKGSVSQGEPAPQSGAQSQLQAAIATLLANTDDVGDRFAEEARRIHYGETAARGIRGQATAAEVTDLHEEGIAVLALPWPARSKDSLQ